MPLVDGKVYDDVLWEVAQNWVGRELREELDKIGPGCGLFMHVSEWDTWYAGAYRRVVRNLNSQLKPFGRTLDDVTVTKVPREDGFTVVLENKKH